MTKYQSKKGAEFSRIFNKYLREQGLSCADVCRKTGISKGLISNYYRGLCAPTAANLQLIAKAFGVPVSDLMVSKDDVDRAGLEQKIQRIYSQLPPEKQEEALNYLEYLKSQSDKSKK